MNRIVPWQIAMVIVTIGTYAIVLANGGSVQTAVAFAVAFVAATVAAVVAAVVAAATVAATIAVAFAVAYAAAAAVIIAFAAATVATAFAAATVATAIAVAFVAATVAVAATTAIAFAVGLSVPKRWTFTAYGIGVAVISGALLTGSIGWALAIGAVGILALFAVWRFGPAAMPVGTAPVPAPNGG